MLLIMAGGLSLLLLMFSVALCFLPDGDVP